MTCGITVAPRMPTASSTLLGAGELRRDRVEGDLPAVGPRQQRLDQVADGDDADQHRDDGLQRTEAEALQAENGEGRDARQQPGQQQRHMEEQIEADRRAQELGEVGRHRANLGDDPEADARPRRGRYSRQQLRQIPPGGDAQLGRERLQQHGHQVAGEDDPEQQVAKLRAGLDVGGEVAGVDIGDGGDEGRPDERERGRAD